MSNIEILEDILEGLKAIKAGELTDMQIKAEVSRAVQRLPHVRDDLLKKLAIMEYEDGQFVRGK